MQEWCNLFSISDVYVRHFNSYLVFNISCYQNTEPLCPLNIFFAFWRYSPHVRESGFRNPEKFCLWNPESLFGQSGFSLTIGIQNPQVLLTNTGIQYLESGMENPRLSRIPLRGAKISSN